jgi:hypothetical protein
LLQRESALKVNQVVAREWAERQLPAFDRASQNVAMVAMLLNALLEPSTNGAGEVYRRLIDRAG